MQLIEKVENYYSRFLNRAQLALKPAIAYLKEAKFLQEVKFLKDIRLLNATEGGLASFKNTAFLKRVQKIEVKHYLLFINLLLLFVCINLAGRFFATIIESTLFNVPRRDVAFTPPEVKKEARKYALSDFDIIWEQNIFNVTVGNEKPEVVVEEQQPVEEANDQLKKLLETFELKGIMSMGIGSLAAIDNKKTRKSGVFGVDDEIFETSAYVHSIEATKVWVILGNSKGFLEFPEEMTLEKLMELATPKKKEALKELEPKEKKKRPETTKATTPPPADKRVFNLKSKEIDDALANFSKLIMQARVVPYMRGGENLGYQIRKIEKGSLYERIGLKNQDIIKRVNGSPIDSPEKAMQLFKIMRNEREVIMEIERSKKDITLTYNIS